MKLLTKEILKRFEKTGRQGENPTVIAKFFNPCGRGHWYATEYHPEERLFFGFVRLFYDHNDEWGDFSLDELEQLRCPPLGLPIERDLHFTPKPFDEIGFTPALSRKGG